jgi:hypothetical protein
VIERRYRQRNLFEAVLGSVEELVEGLIEPSLRRLDEVLADEALLDGVGPTVVLRGAISKQTP